MNRGTIVTAAQAIYNEETGDFISEAYLQARYNEAKGRIERRTLFYRVAETITVTASTAYTIMPAGMFAIRRGGVYIASWGPLNFTTWKDLVAAYPLTWNSTESTYPDRFYLYPAAVTAGSVTNWAIGFYPLVSTTLTNGGTVYGYSISADADADATAPPWPTPYHFALVWELCVMAATRDMDYQMRNAKPLAHFRAELKAYEDEMRAASSEYNAMGGVLQIGAGAPGQDEDDVVMIVNVTT